MTATEFAEALRALIGAAEDDGLERPEMIAALLAQVDEAGPAAETGPDGFVEALGRLVALADACRPGAGRGRRHDPRQADAMREAAAELNLATVLVECGSRGRQ